MRKSFLLAFLALTVPTANATLSLEAVMNSTKEHYPKILQAKQKIAEKEQALIKAQGQFDPSIDNSVKLNPQGGYENRYSRLRLTIPVENTPLKLFGQYRIGQGQWPEYFKNYLTNSNGEAIIGFELPLIKDLLIDVKRGNIAAKRYQIQLAKYEAFQTEISTLQQAGIAYWRWVLEANKRDFAKKLLDLAKKRQYALKRRKQLGDGPDIDLVENKRFILKRKENLVHAELKVKQASLNLSLYYRNSHGKPITPGVNQAPKFKFFNQALRQPNKNDIMAEVFAVNPSLRILDKLKQITQIEINLAKNKLLPTLNASLSTKKQYGQDGDPLLKKTNIFAGLTFNFPLYQREAKGSYSMAINKYSQLTLQENYLSQQLHVALEKILSEQRADQERLALISAEVTLAKKIEHAERIRFNAGDSSLFLVNQREQTTFSLEILACQILTEFKFTVLQLEALKGFLK